MNIFSQLFNFIFKVIINLIKSANYIASLFNLFLPSPSELYIHIIVEYFHVQARKHTWICHRCRRRAKLISITITRANPLYWNKLLLSNMFKLFSEDALGFNKIRWLAFWLVYLLFTIYLVNIIVLCGEVW